MKKQSAKINKTIPKFDPGLIEKRWQAVWEKEKTYQPDLDASTDSTSPLQESSGQGKPFYNLMMFPYPSAEGMHVGNMYAFTGSDVYGRFKRMRGNEVFEPIGLDGFGIHSENYALKVGRHPKEQAKISEKNFYRQLHVIGNGFAWDNKVETYDPEYYKWTQWIFIQLFKAGLAYRKTASVNFCPQDKTVLADEQVIAGKCERCGTQVVKKDLEQWFFKITDYAERLLNNIEKLDWTEKVKIAQREWIGRSEGLLFTAPVKDSKLEIQTFSAHFEAFYADTFVVIAPDHPFLKELIKDVPNKKEIQEFADNIIKKRTQKKYLDNKNVEGIFTGKYIEDPVGNGDLPIWVASYALREYGTGIVKCSVHDERDFAFAKKYGIALKPVLFPKDPKLKKKVESLEICYKDMKNGYLTEPVEFVGKRAGDIKSQIVKYAAEKGFATPKTQFHLRDWLISRQRYWGPPIPMINCPKCGWQAVPESDLPVLLPEVKDWKPKGDGKSPLASIESFVNTRCPNCGGPARRETDVSDTFLDSAWYFFRYIATDLKDIPFPFGNFSSEIAHVARDARQGDSKSSKFTRSLNEKGLRSKSSKKPGSSFSSLANAQSSEHSRENFENSPRHETNRTEMWLPVDMYIGGAEHSVLHLLYSRFITMVFKDLGLISFEEPYIKFRAHGLLIKEGAKMSKSRGNVVIPDQYIKKFGADTLRLYLMFLGPFTQGGDFHDTGIEGMHRFVKRVWRLVGDWEARNLDPNDQKTENPKSLYIMHRTIKKVTGDIEGLRYNTAIASIMEYYNFLSREQTVSKEEIKTLIQLISPFAPHVSEELWCELGFKKSVHKTLWPAFDEKFIEEEIRTIVVQINGKTRDLLKVDSADINDKQKIEESAKKSPKAEKYIRNSPIRKVIYVPGRIINFVLDDRN